MNRFVQVLFIALVASSAQAQVPPPRIEPVRETVNGVEIRDPYRWMERGDAEFLKWAHAEAEQSRAVLDSLPGRAALYRRIVGLDKPGNGITGLQARAGRWVFERLADAGDKRVLHVRSEPGGSERALDLLAGFPAADGPWNEVRHARVLSPNGRYLTFGTTRKGEADPVLRVYDLEEERTLADQIDWPLWADSSGFRPRWLADSSGFLYVRRADADAKMDNTARARRGQVFLHRIGTSRSADRALFGFGITHGIAETDTLYVEGDPHPRWLSILRRMPEGREIWVLDLARLDHPGPPAARMIHATDVQTHGYGVLGDSLYVVDSKGAPRYQLVRYDLRKDAPTSEVVVPQQEGVLDGLAVGIDAIYFAETVLDQSKLHVLEGASRRVVALDAGGVDALEAGPDGRGAWIEQVSWTRPRRGRWLAAGEVRARDLAFAPPVAEAGTNFASRVEWATARDGVRIPYTIVQRADAPADGSGYVMLDGYGCFGTAEPAFYWAALQAWLEKGGVFVHAALRGGGELGADWHRAGRDRNKPAAFEDAIDISRHLIRTRVTRPGRIGVTGASCGGTTMGMAALEAPHLISAAVLSVGAFDPWRMAGQTSAGARSIRDFGDPATEEGTRRILALAPYDQILDGVERPAFYIDSGATDYAIPLWVGGKMVARARAALPAGKPVLWGIDWNGGHNVGVDYSQLDADNFSFLLWQLGHPEFQPAAGPLQAGGRN